VDLLGAMRDPVGSDTIEGGGGVGHHPGDETQVARHPSGRGDAVIRGEPDDDQAATTGAPQIGLQGGPDESAVDPLLDHHLSRDGSRLGLEVVTGLARPQGRGGIGRHVAHVHDRAPGAAPRAQQVGGVLFQVPVVPSAPGGRFEAPLEVHDQECGRQPFEGKHDRNRKGAGPAPQNDDAAHRRGRW
jgi:hypothetical protein